LFARYSPKSGLLLERYLLCDLLGGIRVKAFSAEGLRDLQATWKYVYKWAIIGIYRLTPKENKLSGEHPFIKDIRLLCILPNTEKILTFSCGLNMFLKIGRHF